jgi:3-hydroxyisobutyrate dehydrogenase-like beta-hydroxyacid dehydrogenase
MGAGDTRRQAPVIGILYPGEMGSALGRALADGGSSVVTTLQGRSPRTERLCRDAGLEVLPSLRAVAEAAHLVISTVPPAAAAAVAQAYGACGPFPLPARVYLDLNSVSPDTMARIEALLTRAGVECLDGAVHGLAAQLHSRGTVYLSGTSAGRAAALFGPCLRVHVVGDRPGRASAMKMLISGLPKGLAALFLELALAAREAGLLEELLACYREAYPGVMAVVDRLVPTYPQHAGRRGEEMEEVEQMLLSLGLQPCLMTATRRLTAEVARLGLGAQPHPDGAGPWSVPRVIEALHARHPFRRPAPAEPAGACSCQPLPFRPASRPADGAPTC